MEIKFYEMFESINSCCIYKMTSTLLLIYIKIHYVYIVDHVTFTSNYNANIFLIINFYAQISSA